MVESSESALRGHFLFFSRKNVLHLRFISFMGGEQIIFVKTCI